MKHDCRRIDDDGMGPRLCGVAAALIGGGATILGGAISANAAKKAGQQGSAAAERATDASMEQYYQNREDQLAQYKQNREDTLAQLAQNRADLTPWREAGMGALEQLKTGTQEGGDFARDFTLADFQRDPGYQFRMDEGQRALESSAAARGGVLSGRALKDIERYGQDYASGEYTNAYNRFNADRNSRFNRLSSLAGTSQTAANNIANQGSTAYGNLGQSGANVYGNLATMGMNATNAANEYGLQAANARGSSYVGTANALNQGLGSLSNFYQQQQLFKQLNKPAYSSRPVSDSVSLSDGSTFFGAYPD